MNLSRLEQLLFELLSEEKSLQARPANCPAGEDDGEDSLSLDLDPSELEKQTLRHLLARTYGGDRSQLEAHFTRLNRLCQRFRALFGDGPVRLLRAPARINIIGEHVDYVSYLPTASLTFGSREHDMVMLYREKAAAQISGASTLENCDHCSFTFLEGPSVRMEPREKGDWASYLYSHPMPEPHWGNYVKGSVFFARMKYGRQIRRGFQFLVDSTIPPGGGASSSSTLTVLAGAALRQANHLHYSPLELAQDSARAEWYLGTRGGAMDHTTICMARRRNAVHISYALAQADLTPLPSDSYRWVTFFSHPADKSREIMLEYNARAAVSRLLIPAVLDHLRQNDERFNRAWQEAVAVIGQYHPESFTQLRRLLTGLPETMSLRELEQKFPSTFQACTQAFPALVQHRSETPLSVRNLALHHVGEIERVNAAVSHLRGHAPNGPGAAHAAGVDMPLLGKLLDESHKSLRDYYEVSTPTVERLMEILRKDNSVLGARLMGGGFGGNILALVPVERLPDLLSRVQSEFYGPQGRDGIKNKLVMVSTPGDGLSEISPECAFRSAIIHFAAHCAESDQGSGRIHRLLDAQELRGPSLSVWPVVVAAGKGERARKSGLEVPKPLAEVSGVPAVLRVLQSIRQAEVQTHPPIVIVSPETEPLLRRALAGWPVTFVVQAEPKGTGDAVFCAKQLLEGFCGRVLILWGTQPVVRTETIRRTISLANLFPEYDMVLPTAVIEQPYAPLLRDQQGRVQASRETHLERAQTVSRGETNIGLFLLKNETLLEQLDQLRQLYWVKEEGRYNRPGGELGLPNELITSLASRPAGVLALPIADWREAQGIKGREDLELCERYILELARQES